MIRNSILFTAFLAVIYITLSSDIDGAAHHGHGNITGSASGITGHCQTSSCHGSNNPLTIVNLKITDTSTMLPVTIYNALQTYMVTITGNDTDVASTLPGFGFMASAVLGNHTQAGTYVIPSSLAGKIHTFPCGAQTVVEHTVVLAPDSVGVNKYSVYFYWTAPSPGSDSVSFYSLLNAVNHDGGSSGDYPNAASIVTIYENPATAGVKTTGSTQSTDKVSVYPNPCISSPTVSYYLSAEERVSMDVFDTYGKKLETLTCNELQAAGLHQYHPSVTVPGTYFVRFSTGSTSDVCRFIKL